MFLTPAQLHDLTGYTQPGRQAAALDRYGIQYVRRGDGAIRVTWEQVNAPRGRADNDKPNLEAARG